MKFALLSALAFGGLSFAAMADPAFNLKPGFYSGDEQGWRQLSALDQRADVNIDLSGHAGISLGDRQNLTLGQLKEALKQVKTKHLALILFEKNYTDEALHFKVEKLLFSDGFKEVLITRAHSSGTFLVKYTNSAERAIAPNHSLPSSQKPSPATRGSKNGRQ